MNRVFTPYINYIRESLAQLDFQTLINSERMGLAPQIEGELRRRLQGVGLNQFIRDILYGFSIPFEVRKKWQEQGIDPDSEDEVYNFIKQFSSHRKDYLMPPLAPSKPSLL